MSLPSITPKPSPGYRNCEFCGCHTNAAMRACCDQGKQADQVLAQMFAGNPLEMPLDGQFGLTLDGMRKAKLI